MRKILKWFKTSFQDRKGHASSRKLTAFLGMLILLITWFMDLFYDKTIDTNLLYAIFVLTGLSMALFTTQNIIEFAKAIRQQDYGYGMGYPYNNENTNININNKKKDEDPPIIME